VTYFQALRRCAATAADRPFRPELGFVLDRPAPPFLYAFAAGRFAEASLTEVAHRRTFEGPAGLLVVGIVGQNGAILPAMSRPA
jgi:hypothetical protein